MEEVAAFVREPLALSLLSVPGIDKDSTEKLNSKGIVNTHQLMGQFLLFHARDVDPEQLRNRFGLWLIKLGVTRNTSAVVSAVAEKAGTWVDGVYSPDDTWDLCCELGCSDVGSTSPGALQARYLALSTQNQVT